MNKNIFISTCITMVEIEVYSHATILPNFLQVSLRHTAAT